MSFSVIVARLFGTSPKRREPNVFDAFPLDGYLQLTETKVWQIPGVGLGTHVG
jgi:hypothetical protein